MILPLTLALGAVALGTALGLLRGHRGVHALQVAALAAAAAVALGHLLPESVRALGPLALLPFGLPIALSAGLLWLRPNPGGDAIGIEIGYAALVVHRLTDGVMLGAYGGAVHPAGEHADLLAALALHAIPVSAAVALRFSRSDGLGAALGRAAGMAAGSAAGVALASGIPLEVATRIDPWASAAIAGLLLYVALREGSEIYRSF